MLEQNNFSKMKLIDIYNAYGYIRYTVQSNHCKPITADEVKRTITSAHKEKIKRLFGYDHECIEKIIDYVVSYSKL